MRFDTQNWKGPVLSTLWHRRYIVFRKNQPRLCKFDFLPLALDALKASQQEPTVLVHPNKSRVVEYFPSAAVRRSGESSKRHSPARKNVLALQHDTLAAMPKAMPVIQPRLGDAHAFVAHLQHLHEFLHKPLYCIFVQYNVNTEK